VTSASSESSSIASIGRRCGRRGSDGGAGDGASGRDGRGFRDAGRASTIELIASAACKGGYRGAGSNGTSGVRSGREFCAHERAVVGDSTVCHIFFFKIKF
jgi:hypothetical protein